MLVNEGVTMHRSGEGTVISLHFVEFVVSYYGSTEVGPATMFIPRDTPSAEEWEYFKMSNHIKFVMQPQENLPDLFEPVIIVSNLL